MSSGSVIHDGMTRGWNLSIIARRFAGGNTLNRTDTRDVGINSLKNYSTIIFFVSPFLFEIGICVSAYLKRLGFDGEKNRTEFNTCQRKISVVAIVLSASLVGNLTIVDYFLKPYYSIIFVISRLISTILVIPIMRLYHRNEMTVIEYINKRFQSILFTIFTTILGVMILCLSINNSVDSFYSTFEVFGFNASVFLGIMFAYSIIQVIVGGMRGFLWTGAFRFLMVTIFQMYVLIRATIKVFGKETGAQVTDIPIPQIQFDWLETLIAVTTYFLILNLSVCTLSKFTNAIADEDKAVRSMYLIILPYGVLNFIRDFLSIVIRIYYSKKGCDHLQTNFTLSYRFIDEQFSDAKHIYILFAISNLFLGGFVISDSIMTLWYYITFFKKRIELLFDLHRPYAPCIRSIELYTCGSAFALIYLVGQFQLENENQWLSIMLMHVTFASATLTAILVIISCLVPRFPKRLLWHIPLVIVSTFLIMAFFRPKTSLRYGSKIFYMSNCYDVYKGNCSTCVNCYRPNMSPTAISLLSTLFIFTISFIVIIGRRLSAKPSNKNDHGNESVSNI